jgi:hypothetical protein
MDAAAVDATPLETRQQRFGRHCVVCQYTARLVPLETRELLQAFCRTQQLVGVLVHTCSRCVNNETQ